MQGKFGQFSVLMSGIVCAASIAGCGGTTSETASTPPSPSVDPHVAFQQYEDAAKPFECSPAYGAMGDADHDGNFGAMKEHARTYRDVVATWDAALGDITFPDAARPIVGGIRELNAIELAGLRELADMGVEDQERIAVVRGDVETADSSVALEGDRLRAVLGHPEPPAGVAADQLEVAERTFLKDTAPVVPKFKAALAADDLDAAKATNAIEVDAAQHYIDRLDAIEWPPQSERQVDKLRDYLRTVIDFDRRQVDVATTADIDLAPKDAPNPDALYEVKDALWASLVKIASEGMPPRC